MTEVKTQAQLDAALKKGNAYVILRGDGRFSVSSDSVIVRAWDSVIVEASGSVIVEASDSVIVRASGSVIVEASGSATVRASGSATVRASDSVIVRASDSVIVEASGSATVRASGSATVRAFADVMIRLYGGLLVEATAGVVILIHKAAKEMKGGQRIKAKRPETARDWCEHWGAPVKRGVATLYKAVDDNFQSPHGGDYAPGTTPEAPDWDGGAEECGGGLHFSPQPWMALSFNRGATKFVACPVRLKDIAVHPDGLYPDKVKAKGCCKPAYEVDRDGEPVK